MLEYICTCISYVKLRFRKEYITRNEKRLYSRNKIKNIVYMGFTFIYDPDLHKPEAESNILFRCI